jgi:NAD(P)-dependent dehydrogenase (short-subunit alcohol dehydrogenase family)
VADYPLPAYKVSKAALNALTMQYALALQKEGFVVVAINPGVSSLPSYNVLVITTILTME